MADTFISIFITLIKYYFQLTRISERFSRFASRGAFCERGEKFMVAASRGQETLCRSSLGLAINLSAMADGP